MFVFSFTSIFEANAFNIFREFLFTCRIIDGLETLEQLEKLPVNPKNYRPLTETRINSVTIHANPLAG